MQMSQPVQRRSQRTAPISAGKCGKAVANGAKPFPWGPCSLRVLPRQPEAPCHKLADRVSALHRVSKSHTAQQ